MEGCAAVCLFCLLANKCHWSLSFGFETSEKNLFKPQFISSDAACSESGEWILNHLMWQFESNYYVDAAKSVGLLEFHNCNLRFPINISGRNNSGTLQGRYLALPVMPFTHFPGDSQSSLFMISTRKQIQKAGGLIPRTPQGNQRCQRCSWSISPGQKLCNTSGLVKGGRGTARTYGHLWYLKCRRLNKMAFGQPIFSSLPRSCSSSP